MAEVFIDEGLAMHPDVLFGIAAAGKEQEAKCQCRCDVYFASDSRSA